MAQEKRESALWSDPPLLIVSLLLTFLGVVMIYSATHNLAQESIRRDPYLFLKKHLFSLLIGGLALWIATKFPIERLRQWAIPFLLLVLGLLMLVHVPGFGLRAGGAIRWIKIAGIRLGQPAELAKVAVVLYLASSLARKQDRIEKFTVGYLPHIIVLGAFGVLLMSQPDFGTSMMLLTMTAILLFSARVPLRYLIGSALLALPGIYLMLILSPYRWRRIMSFLDPFAKENILDGSYQLVQSLKAFASGGLWGVGLGHSKQKLGYLPEAHTDFIFAVVGEELGFIGVLIIMSCLLFLLYRGLRIALRSPDLFQRLLAIGLTSMIGVQSLINIGVVIGALPTKGMPLPFISFARSSLIVVLGSIGLLLQIEHKTLVASGAYDVQESPLSTQSPKKKKRKKPRNSKPLQASPEYS